MSGKVVTDGHLTRRTTKAGKENSQYRFTGFAKDIRKSCRQQGPLRRLTLMEILAHMVIHDMVLLPAVSLLRMSSLNVLSG